MIKAAGKNKPMMMALLMSMAASPRYVIMPADNVYYVIDYSTNGTFLMDGTRLPMGRAQSFKLGTKICFENQHHVFQLR